MGQDLKTPLVSLFKLSRRWDATPNQTDANEESADLQFTAMRLDCITFAVFPRLCSLQIWKPLTQSARVCYPDSDKAFRFLHTHNGEENGNVAR